MRLEDRDLNDEPRSLGVGGHRAASRLATTPRCRPRCQPRCQQCVRRFSPLPHKAAKGSKGCSIPVGRRSKPRRVPGTCGSDRRAPALGRHIVALACQPVGVPAEWLALLAGLPAWRAGCMKSIPATRVFLVEVGSPSPRRECRLSGCVSAIDCIVRIERTTRPGQNRVRVPARS